MGNFAPPLGSCILGIAAGIVAVRVIFYAVVVHGHSMRPAMREGEVLVALRWWPRHLLRKGNVVVWTMDGWLVTVPRGIEPPDVEYHVKRVAGLPGDTVITYLSSLPSGLRRSIQHAFEPDGTRTWHIPAGHVFLAGDSVGFDSHIAGPVPVSCLRGLVLWRLGGGPKKPPVRRNP